MILNHMLSIPDKKWLGCMPVFVVLVYCIQHCHH